VSASARGLDFMVKHGIKGIIGGGAATMAEGPVYGYREAAARAGKDLALGEGLCLSIFIYLAETREKAIREVTPYYEEHVKMFGPLGFVPGITPAQLAASTKRGGWGAAGVPTVEHYMKNGSWYAGPPEELTAWLRDLQSRFPGLEHVNVSISMGTPKAVMLEQLSWFGKEIMPTFTGGRS
jgi:alkanesulfonate monooxygenase SsuD/methylene tetrahydromethanopterin reductase-like flavin-dependent oxidoreductase (luciferase family)